MTHALKAMPGLDRLLETLTHYGIGADPQPASHQALKAGDLILGEPFDPILAAFYARCDGGLFGDLEIHGFDPKSGLDLVAWNSFARHSAPELFPLRMKCFQYGSEFGQPYYLTTVPSLADAVGVQPVVFILQFMDLEIYPLASSVDKMFDLWARFADARLRRYGRLDAFMIASDVPHLWNEAQLIAQDTELVRMLKAGKFDEFLGSDPDMHQWKKSILQAARSASSD